VRNVLVPAVTDLLNVFPLRFVYSGVVLAQRFTRRLMFLAVYEVHGFSDQGETVASPVTATHNETSFTLRSGKWTFFVVAQGLGGWSNKSESRNITLGELMQAMLWMRLLLPLMPSDVAPVSTRVYSFLRCLCES